MVYLLGFCVTSQARGSAWGLCVSVLENLLGTLWLSHSVSASGSCAGHVEDFPGDSVLVRLRSVSMSIVEIIGRMGYCVYHVGFLLWVSLMVNSRSGVFSVQFM